MVWTLTLMWMKSNWIELIKTKCVRFCVVAVCVCAPFFSLLYGLALIETVTLNLWSYTFRFQWLANERQQRNVYVCACWVYFCLSTFNNSFYFTLLEGSFFNNKKKDAVTVVVVFNFVYVAHHCHLYPMHGCMCCAYMRMCMQTGRFFFWVLAEVFSVACSNRAGQNVFNIIYNLYRTFVE